MYRSAYVGNGVLVSVITEKNNLLNIEFAYQVVRF